MSRDEAVIASCNAHALARESVARERVLGGRFICGAGQVRLHHRPGEKGAFGGRSASVYVRPNGAVAPGSWETNGRSSRYS